MLFLSKYALSGRLQALLVIMAAGLLALIIPLVGWISAGTLALVVLRQSTHNGMLTVTLAFAGCLLFLVLMNSSATAAVIMLFYLWVPAFISALVLRKTNSLPYAVLVTSVIGLLVVVGIYALLGNPEMAWRQYLEQLLPLKELLQTEMQLSDAQQAAYLENASRLMTGLLAASLCLHSMVSVFWGRWQQAVLYNPGGFQLEFHGLRLGSVASGLFAILLVLALIARNDFVDSLLMVASVAFIIQGLAVIHAIVRLKALNNAWLVIVYFFAITTPQVMIVLALLGMLDPWLNLRKRFLKRSN